jgi:hypothetical protein
MYAGFICLALFGVAFGQSPQGHATRRAVVIPPDVALPVVASQPDSPLQIEDVRLFKYVNGGSVAQTFKVRNSGTKAIRSYTVGAWNSVGTGWEIEQPVSGGGLPGQTSSPEDGGEAEVVELTEKLRNELDLRGGMKTVVVFMVVRVEYTDGSTYNNQSVYEALKTHLDKIAQ